MANSRFHLVLFNIFGLDGDITNVIKIKMKPLARTRNIISKSRENVSERVSAAVKTRKLIKQIKKLGCLVSFHVDILGFY